MSQSSEQSLATTIRQTTTAFLHAFELWTTEAVLAVRAPECEHIMLPGSLGVAKLDNAGMRARFEKLEGLIRNVKVISFAPTLYL